MSVTSCKPDSLLIQGRFGSMFGNLVLLMCLLTLVAWGGGGDRDEEGEAGDELPPPPKIAGIWSGTWEGIDSTFGPAAGTWEAEISQKASTCAGR